MADERKDERAPRTGAQGQPQPPGGARLDDLAEQPTAEAMNPEEPDRVRGGALSTGISLGTPPDPIRPATSTSVNSSSFGSAGPPEPIRPGP